MPIDFEFSANRFVNPRRIVTANIYTKQANTPNDKGEYLNVIRVALDLDVKETLRNVVYSDPFANVELAKEWIKKIPNTSAENESTK